MTKENDIRNDMNKYLKYPYSQREQLGTAFGASIPKQYSIGACFGLCLGWIDAHKDAKRNFKAQYRIAAAQHAAAAQLVCEPGTKFNDALALHSTYTQPAEAEFKNSSIFFVFPKEVSRSDFKEAASRLKNTKSYYNIYMTLSGQSSGHAIAAYRSAGFAFNSHLYIFDPNIGECIASSSEIDEFFCTLYKYYELILGMRPQSFTFRQVI